MAAAAAASPPPPPLPSPPVSGRPPLGVARRVQLVDVCVQLVDVCGGEHVRAEEFPFVVLVVLVAGAGRAKADVETTQNRPLDRVPRRGGPSRGDAIHRSVSTIIVQSMSRARTPLHRYTSRIPWRGHSCHITKHKVDTKSTVCLRLLFNTDYQL